MEKNLFGQPVKNDRVTYENIRKIAICWLYNWLFVSLCLF